MTDDLPDYTAFQRSKRSRRPSPATGGGEQPDRVAAALMPLEALPAPMSELAIYDQQALLNQLEHLYGRPYLFDDEVDLGLPQPSLTTEEQARLEKLRWLADDGRGPGRPLLFGRQAIRDRLAQVRLTCPTFRDVVDLVDRAVALSILSEAPISIPPLLLLGAPGIGKTHASKAIAKALGTSTLAFSCATNSDAQQLIAGHPTSWRGSRMGVVNEAMASGSTAQPIILLDEIDKFESHRDEQPYNVLLNILERENSAALQDEYLRIPFDLSRAFFIATANDADRLPPYIQDRLVMFDIPVPTGGDLLAITRLIASAALDEARGAIEPPDDKVIARLARANPRRISRIVRLALGYAAAAGRRNLTVGDVDAADGLAAEAHRKEAIGFIRSHG